jgi:hypothetical protein
MLGNEVNSEDTILVEVVNQKERVMYRTLVDLDGEFDFS